MPLIKEKLYENIMRIVIYPNSQRDAAIRWSNALDDYCNDLLFPSTTHQQAKNAFISTFMTMNYNTDGRIIFQNCFNVYTAALAPGMLPGIQMPNLFQISTPPTNINLFPYYNFCYNNVSNMEECIKKLVDIVHPWFLTGLLTYSYIPYATINWQ